MEAFSPLHVIIRAIMRFLIWSLICTLAVWVVLWLSATGTINNEMDYLTNKVTEMNCLDVQTGEYALFCERLLRIHNNSNFIRFTTGINGTAVTIPGDDMVRFQITGINPGNDSFTIRQRTNNAVDAGGYPIYNQGCYDYGTAPQQYEPIEVRLWCRLYLPMPVYFGKIYADDDPAVPLTNAFGLQPSVLPNTFGRPNPTPALCVELLRREVVLGTQYYKGQTLSDTYDHNLGH